MAISFPSSPTQGQIYYSSGRTWTWSGTEWMAGTSVTQNLQVIGTATATQTVKAASFVSNIYTLGSTINIITPDVSLGSVQSITLTGNITLNTFLNPVAGQTLTLLITQPATGNYTLSSSMLFEGGISTLSNTSNSLDILTVMFTGSKYFAKLTKSYSNPFTPLTWFASGEPGVWFDPSDFIPNWRRNILTYSEQFDNAVWTTPLATITPNANTAPNSTLTADLVVVNSGSSLARLGPFATISSWIPYQVYTISVYAKNLGLPYLTISLDNNAGYSTTATFDLITLTSTLTTHPAVSDLLSSSVSSAGNNWYRCSFTFRFISGVFYLRFMPSLSSSNLAGDGTSGMLLWGAQLEKSLAATDYQKITNGVQDYYNSQSQPVLFQDLTGNIPVTAVEQPVGLMLDKSKGLALGSELLVNGDASSGLSGWTTTTWSVNGLSQFTANTGNLQQSNVVTVGKWYLVKWDQIGPLVNTLNVFVGVGTVIGFTGQSPAGSKSVIAQATTDTRIIFQANGANTTIDNISVKEISGNHAFQATNANRPILSSRVNLFSYTEQFDNAYWKAYSASTVTANALIAPNGTLTADKVAAVNAINNGAFENTTPIILGSTVSVYARAGNVGWLVVGTANPTFRASFNLINGTMGTFLNCTPSIEFVGNGWYRCVLSNITSADNRVFFCMKASDPMADPWSVGTVAIGDYIYLWGADLRHSNSGTLLPSYQYVNSDTDYDTAGFPLYLKCNGANTSMITGNINFSTTNTMTIITGVRKSSDAVDNGMVFELSTGVGNDGMFDLRAPGTIANKGYMYVSRANTTNIIDITANVAAPITNILTFQSSIPTPISIARVNGVQVAVNTLTQGVGNYGNYPLHLFARTQNSLYFNGNFYGTIIRGASSDIASVIQTEQYISNKTGITI